MPRAATTRPAAGPVIDTADFVPETAVTAAATAEQITAEVQQANAAADLPPDPRIPAVERTSIDPVPLMPPPAATARDLAIQALLTPPPIATTERPVPAAEPDVRRTGTTYDWSNGTTDDVDWYLVRAQPFRRELPNPDWEKGSPADVPRKIVKQARRGDLVKLPVDARTAADLGHRYIELFQP